MGRQLERSIRITRLRRGRLLQGGLRGGKSIILDKEPEVGLRAGSFRQVYGIIDGERDWKEKLMLEQ